MEPDLDQLYHELRAVIDPEIGINIVDLGLIYGLEYDDKGLRMRLTMTSAACPMSDLIIANCRMVLDEVLPPNTPVDIELVWEPPWTPEMMTGEVRNHFGWSGS